MVLPEATALYKDGVSGYHSSGWLMAGSNMILGGVPYYLSLLDNKMGLPANVDRLFFSEDATPRKAAKDAKLPTA